MFAAMRFGLGIGLLLALGVACDSESGAASDTLQDDDIPMGGNDASAGGSDAGNGEGGENPPGAGVGEPCDGTTQCQSGVCAAPFDSEDPGELVCQTSCIELMDPALWCSDAASCCDAEAICTARGFCVAGAPAADSDAESDSGEESTSGSTGESSEESTSSGSDGGSTSTGA